MVTFVYVIIFSFIVQSTVYMIFELLGAAKQYVERGDITGIRISTRPDAIDSEVLAILKEYGVEAIELGAQSMDDRVLTLNRRGHTADDVRRASRLIKDSAFFAAGIKLSVAISPRSAFAETVVAFAVNFMCLGDIGKVFLARMHVFSAFNDYRFHAKFDKPQRSKQSCRTGTNDNDLPIATYGMVVDALELVVVRHFVDETSHTKVYEYVAMPCVDTLSQHANLVYRPCVNPLFLCHEKPYALLVERLLRRNPYVVFVNHECKVTNNNTNKQAIRQYVFCDTGENIPLCEVIALSGRSFQPNTLPVLVSRLVRLGL